MKMKVWADFLEEVKFHLVRNRPKAEQLPMDYWRAFVDAMEAKGYELRHFEKDARSDQEFVQEIIRYLNIKTNSGFRSELKSATAGLVLALKKDGYSLEQLMAVVDAKIQQWRGTKYEVNLTPKTLFKKDNFETYVGQIGKYAKQQTGPIDETKEAVPGRAE